LGTRFLLKPLIITTLLLSTLALYFKETYGVKIDEGIILSTFDAITEKNFNEIGDLFTFKLLFFLLMITILPSIPLFFIKISYPSIIKEYSIRLVSITLMLVIFLGMVLINYKDISLTTRVLKQFKLNQETIPHHSIDNFFKIIKEQFKKKSKYKNLDNNPVLINKKQEIVGIVLVGETARADRFSLNGYSKKTNPLLEKQKGVVNYKEAFACGTLTKISVPCMFYLGDYNQFSQKKARFEQNALDIAHKAGVNTIWLENNSSSKHVADRIKRIDIIDNTKNIYDDILVKMTNDFLIDKSTFWKSYYPAKNDILFNEIELKRTPNLESYMSFKKNQNEKERTLIVLHMMGSHGPKYYERYPSEFDQFQPSCKSNNPQECSQEELSNAFDNTILYTDYIIDSLIKILQKQNKESFLIYASDHGESLGENGLYLHGVPVAFAPKEQVHIPWLIWYSDKYKKNNKITFKDPSKKITHEFFAHTILRSLKINSKTLKKNKSLIQLD